MTHPLKPSPQGPYRSALPASASLLLVLLLNGCSGPTTPQPGPTTEKQPETPVTEQGSDLYLQGIEALAIKDFDSAASIFKRFNSQYTAKSGGHANLALISLKQGDIENATISADQAIELNPNNAAAHNLKGLINLEQGKIKTARDNFRTAIDIKPDYSNAHYNLALVYDIYLQDIAKAIEHYSRYLALTTEKDPGTQDWVDYLKSQLNNG